MKVNVKVPIMDLLEDKPYKKMVKDKPIDMGNGQVAHQLKETEEDMTVGTVILQSLLAFNDDKKDRDKAVDRFEITMLVRDANKNSGVIEITETQKTMLLEAVYQTQSAEVHGQVNLALKETEEGKSKEKD